jgi:hypothetical protein
MDLEYQSRRRQEEEARSCGRPVAIPCPYPRIVHPAFSTVWESSLMHSLCVTAITRSVLARCAGQSHSQLCREYNTASLPGQSWVALT